MDNSKKWKFGGGYDKKFYHDKWFLYGHIRVEYKLKKGMKIEEHIFSAGLFDNNDVSETGATFEEGKRLIQKRIDEEIYRN